MNLPKDSSYEKYQTMSTDDRRKIIVQTRQALHTLFKYKEGEERAEPNLSLIHI